MLLKTKTFLINYFFANSLSKVFMHMFIYSILPIISNLGKHFALSLLNIHQNHS